MLQYFILERDIYPIRILKMKEMKYLVEIIQNDRESPFIRFISARMLIALKSQAAHEEIEKLLRNKKNIPKLFMIAAIVDAKSTLEIPKIHVRKESLYKRKVFCRILAALYLNPKKYSALFRELIKDKDEMVVLSALYNCRRHSKLQRYFFPRNINRILYLIKKGKTPIIRAIACFIFWAFEDLLPEVKASVLHKKSEEQLKKYAYTLTNCLKKSHQEAFAAITAIVIDDFLRYHLQTINIPLEKMKENLNYLTRKSSYSIQFWSVSAHYIVDRKKNFFKILDNLSIPSIVRLGYILNMFTHKISQSDALIAADYLQKSVRDQLERPTRKRYKNNLLFAQENFNLFRRNAIFLTSVIGIGKYFPSIYGYLRTHMDKRNPLPIQVAIISSFYWQGKPSDIKRLWPFLESKNFYLQKAAACSLGHLISRYRPEKLPELNQALILKQDEVKKAAAYGYYKTIF